MPSTHPEDFFRDYRAWGWIKHTVYSDYLWPWANKVGFTSPNIFVVEPFAGAGTYRIPDGSTDKDGSPVIAAKAARHYQVVHPGRTMKVIAVERNRANHRRLAERLQPLKDVATVYRGDFHDHIAEIVETIGAAPALINFDPFGLKSITADRCRALIQRAGKIDLFVIVHFGVVHRTAGWLLPDRTANPSITGADTGATNIDAFFWTDEWRQIALDGNLTKMQREEAYLDLYRRSVLGERYRFKSAYAVRPEENGAVKYWLVHASDHPDAMWLMNDSIVKIDELLIRRNLERPGELPGLGSAMADDLLDKLRHDRESLLLDEILQRLDDTDGGLLFDELRGILTPRHFGKVKQGAYGRLIKRLVREGQVEREERDGAAFRPTERIQLRTDALAAKHKRLVKPEPERAQLSLRL